MVCEMCGSTDLIKMDGSFVCQSCGCKYTPEEAKKMMVEVAGTVDVSGSTVKVDTNERLTNLYEIARRARDNNDNETAARYYEMILVDDPQSWEATFYAVYCKTLDCRIVQIESAAKAIDRSLDSVFTLVKEQLSKDEQAVVLKEIELRCVVAATVFYSSAEKHYVEVPLSLKADSTEYTQEFLDRSYASRDLLLHCGDKIESTFGKEPFANSVSVDAWKEGVRSDKELLAFLATQGGSVANLRGAIRTYQKKIKKYEPEYLDDEQREAKEREISSINQKIKDLNKEIQGENYELIEDKPIASRFLLGLAFFFVAALFIYIGNFSFLKCILCLTLVACGIACVVSGVNNLSNQRQRKAMTEEDKKEYTGRILNGIEGLKAQKEELRRQKEELERELSNK